MPPKYIHDFEKMVKKLVFYLLFFQVQENLTKIPISASFFFYFAQLLCCKSGHIFGVSSWNNLLIWLFNSKFLRKLKWISCIMYAAVSSANQVKRSISWTRDFKNQVQKNSNSHSGSKKCNPWISRRRTFDILDIIKTWAVDRSTIQFWTILSKDHRTYTSKSPSLNSLKILDCATNWNSLLLKTLR